VDPHLYPGQSGLSPDTSNDGEGVNYLRRLKGTAPHAVPANVVLNRGDKAPPPVDASDWRDRRQSPRLRCSGTVEFRAEGSDLRYWGTLTDVSLHGCYVEMSTTFPAHTEVNLVLKSFGILVLVMGTIQCSYPFLGMGICFKAVEPAQQVFLQQLLDALDERGKVSNAVSALESGSKQSGVKSTRSPDARAFIDEITEFFQQNKMLSRDEFQKIAHRVRRS